MLPSSGCSAQAANAFPIDRLHQQQTTHIANVKQPSWLVILPGPRCVLSSSVLHALELVGSVTGLASVWTQLRAQKLLL